MLDGVSLNKKELRKAFSRDYESYYKTNLFVQEGFRRHTCKACGKSFWSITERENCDDSEHTPYSFFKERPKPIGYVEFWRKFEKFFESNGHTTIPRYPVVSRWRQDLYFTIASIQDFQRIENGAMNFEYSANPLVVPQICLRFPDIENVGVTGRHLTSFMMAGQHAFNYPREGYWIDRTIELNYKFLTGELGVKKEKLIYNEDVWAMGDFSEFGPSLESFSGGSELVNSVFTQFESVNGKVRELPAKVVDVGWGFERLLWFYTGFDNIYEAVFHDSIEKVKKKLPFEIETKLFHTFAEYASELDVTETGEYKEKLNAILKKTKISEKEYASKIKPMQAFYATLDHTRTLLFAMADGALPSNIGGGYNLRVILRRALGFIGEYNLGLDMMELAEQQASELKGLYPELKENLDILSKVIDVESKRYSRTIENSSKMINALLHKSSSIGKQELRTLYESHGVTPELIASVAAKEGLKITLPDGAYEGIMKGDFAAKEKAKKLDITIKEELPDTEQLYYAFESESNSKVLYVHDNYVILDKTPFYPEGGGQAPDHGTINDLEVVDVQKIGNLIVHVMKVAPHSAIAKGWIGKCKVDTDRRERLMAHHTATHLISAAARYVLGKHAWQEGAHKDADKAHIDIAHYDKLSEQDVDAIERRANHLLLRGIKVEVKEMERGDAESAYGFSIYQGHGVPARRMRIVVITGKDGKLIDAEACGGMHTVARESGIGLIKIINTSRIHDGVDRIEFVAGKAALEYFEREHKELTLDAELTNSERFDIHSKIEKLRADYAQLNKSMQEKDEAIARVVAGELLEKAGDANEIKVERTEDRSILRKALSIAVNEKPHMTILAHNKKGDVVCMSGVSSKTSAIAFVHKTLGSKFKGGGSKTIAEGVHK